MSSSQYSESELRPISALQHLIYCPRQCALIHNEQAWAENRLTVEGQQLHEKAHDTNRPETRPGVRIARGLPLRCLTLGIAGVADIVEFPTPTPIPTPAPGSPAPTPGSDPVPGSTSTPGRKHLASPGVPDSSGMSPLATVPPLPIEYKRGRPKKHDADKVQLCAQALCLEEMLGLHEGAIPEGRLYYGQTRHRFDVPFDNALRQRTRDTIAQLHALLGSGQTPPASYEKSKCDRCSLIGLCMPKQLRPRRTAARVFEDKLNDALSAA